MRAADAAADTPVLRVAAWGDIDGLTHGFFGRRGGVSVGHYASLNVSDSIGDAPGAVLANWRRVGDNVPGLAFATMRQVHGASILRVDVLNPPEAEVDGLLARMAGVGLAVRTADCVPLLCVAPAARAIMALHAGWRGTLAGIAAIGLREAREWLDIPPHAWSVAMGPSIGGCCYEVEAELGDQFVDRWGAMPDAWHRAGSHGQLDLRAANRQILMAHGVPRAQIAEVGPCTSCRSDEYFSHRRSGGRTGRQLSLIGWR
jgi:YfiH family protein